MTYQPSIDVEGSLQRWAPGIMLCAAGLLAAYSFSTEGAKPPRNSSAFGCYISNNRPPILIGKRGLQIVGSSLKPIPFSLDWNDEGIFLWPEKRLVLTDDPQGGGAFTVRDEAGYAFNFVNILNGSVYPDVDATELETFQMITANDRRAAYTKTDPVRCNPILTNGS